MARGINSGDSRLYTDWLEYAENDLVAARLLGKNKATLLLSAFHCQQAVEKALKSYFLYYDGYAPDGHNIVFLCKRAVRKDAKFTQWLDECISINNYYIATRYPPDFSIELTQEKAGALRSMASDVYNFVKWELIKNLGIDGGHGR